jgi:hypothetical protein
MKRTNKSIIYNLILDFDHNIDSDVLVFGSLLFDYIKDDCSFNMDKFRQKAKKYYGYSEKAVCEAFNWLENQGFIYYSRVKTKYFVTDMIKDVLDLHLKCKGE